VAWNYIQVAGVGYGRLGAVKPEKIGSFSNIPFTPLLPVIKMVLTVYERSMPDNQGLKKV